MNRTLSFFCFFCNLTRMRCSLSNAQQGSRLSKSLTKLLLKENAPRAQRGNKRFFWKKYFGEVFSFRVFEEKSLGKKMYYFSLSFSLSLSTSFPSPSQPRQQQQQQQRTRCSRW